MQSFTCTESLARQLLCCSRLEGCTTRDRTRAHVEREYLCMYVCMYVCIYVRMQEHITTYEAL